MNFVRVGNRRLPICKICQTSYVPKTRTALSKLKTCGYKCRDILRKQNGLNERLKQIAHLGKAGWTQASRESYLKNMSGPNNPAWKGGVTFKRTKGNYIGPKYVRCPKEFLGMARRDGYIMEHRLAMAQHLGRLLSRTEVVHHKDHNTRNNHISNLELFPSNAAHKLAEAAEKRKSNQV